jgi:predicted ATP-grasp superfamily ATP-dependent carboligase
VNGFDFILDRDQVWLTEVNPRYSASMELVERAYGLPVFRLHEQAAAAGALPEFSLPARLAGAQFFGKTILFSEKDARAPDTGGWYSRDLRDVPASGETLPQGGPVCTILAAGRTYDQTLARMTQHAAELKSEIYG